jgi:hypothetical protein
MILVLCLIAILCPLRADVLCMGTVRLEFVWSQMHRLFCGISWENAEILFPLGAFSLLFVAFYFAGVVCDIYRSSSLMLWACLFLHLLFRGFVDFYLVTRYFPLHPRYVRAYWTSPGVGWRILAFAGGVASVVAVVLQVRLLWKQRKNANNRPTVRAKALQSTASLINQKPRVS